MSTSEKLDRALETLRTQGHQIGDGTKHSGAISPNGNVLVLVDGRLLTYNEVYELAGMTQS